MHILTIDGNEDTPENIYKNQSPNNSAKIKLTNNNSEAVLKMIQN